MKDESKFKTETTANERAGKLMDEQDELIKLGEALCLLEKEGVETLIFKNKTRGSIDSHLKLINSRLLKLQGQIEKELDKLPSVKVTTKSYKIVQ